MDPVQADPQGPMEAQRQSSQRFTPGDRVHRLIQFEGFPGDDTRLVLAERGVTVIDYVPDNSFLISGPEDLNLEGLGVRWSGALGADDKISPMIEQPLTGMRLDAFDFVVAFHGDISMSSAREAVLAAGIELRDHADLDPHHLLVHTTVDFIVAMSEWDEVAYIFPASDALAGGQPTQACAGALTTAGTVGQYIARVGEGWDGPGLGSAQIRYVFGPLTTQQPWDSVKAEIRRALDEWSRVANVAFVPGTNAAGSKTINILFATGNHGDGFPFDGPSNVLAHTFYPAPPNPEPLAGDMHFDDAERWRIQSDIDLYSVALHELGHALGLAHSDKPGSVMYPYYRMATNLTAEDVGAILTLYAPPGTQAPVMTITPTAPETSGATVTLTGSVVGGLAPLGVRWSTDRGDSGVGTGSAAWTAVVSLQLGVNTITLTATDAQQRSVSSTVVVTRIAVAPTPAPVTLQITGPTAAGAYSTNSAALVLSGTAADSSGIARVDWSSSRGGSGTASGTAAWTIGALTLLPGDTTFTVRATARLGAFAEKGIRVTYTAAAGPPDKTPPSITVTTPASTYFYTSASTLVFSGRATDTVGIASVSWSTNTGKSGMASGTTSWTASIPIVPGANNVKIQATDLAGNTAWRTVVVSRN